MNLRDVRGCTRQTAVSGTAAAVTAHCAVVLLEQHRAVDL